MFKNTYQSGFISILYAGGSRPLAIWGQAVKNGHIRRVTDEDVQMLALEVMGTNVATTYIICPADRKNTLGIRLPFFVMIVKNMKKYFTFEIQILDDKNMSRRFRVSNYQSTTRVRPFSTSLPIGLSGGWNQIQFNLADFTRRAYGSSYLETLRVQIHANVRIRRIYFSDRLYAEDELPQEFKLYVPVTKVKRGKPAKPEKPKEVAEKGTGRDAVEVVEHVPSGALPTPTDTARTEGIITIVMEALPPPQEEPDEEAAGAGSEAAPLSEVPEVSEGESETVQGEAAPSEGAPSEAAPTEEAPSEVEASEAETAPTEVTSEAPPEGGDEGPPPSEVKEEEAPPEASEAPPEAPAEGGEAPPAE